MMEIQKTPGKTHLVLAPKYPLGGFSRLFYCSSWGFGLHSPRAFVPHIKRSERRLNQHDRPFLPGLGNEEGRKLTAVAPLLFLQTLLTTKPYATKMRAMSQPGYPCSSAPVLHCPVFVPHEKLTQSRGGSSVFTQPPATVLSRFCSQR